MDEAKEERMVRSYTKQGWKEEGRPIDNSKAIDRNPNLYRKKNDINKKKKNKKICTIFII